MPDPGSIPFAELMGSASSVVILLMVGAMLLVLWQVIILLGALIAHLWRRHPEEGTGQVRVG